MAINAAVNDFRKESTTELFVVQDGQDEFSSTFIFGNEDHTFGNPLRYILMQKAETEFCGYSVPHPYEPKLNLRLQTRQEPAIKVLASGLTEMVNICDMLEHTFNSAVEKHLNPDPPPKVSRKGSKKG